MGVFDTKENIKKVFTVGDFYTLEVVNLGMSKGIEYEAAKMLEVPFDQMKSELLSTPLKKFERLFFTFQSKKVKLDGYYIYIDFEEVRAWMLKRFLRKWVKKEYRSGCNKPYCESNIRYEGETKSTKYINIYNGEVIEWATGANMMLMFRPR
jgi:hypothetical protein